MFAVLGASGLASLWPGRTRGVTMKSKPDRRVSCVCLRVCSHVCMFVCLCGRV